MTQEDFDKATLAEQILYDCTGMLAENHPSIIETMDKYHQAKLKLLNIGNVVRQSEQLICTFEFGVENCAFTSKDVYTCKHLRKCDKCAN